jgi:hypothetical protein
MMKTLIYFLFFTFSGIVAAQTNCENCYLCEWVYNSRGEKVLYHTLQEAQGLTGGLGGKEQHRKTGSYDQNCINQLKQQQTQAEADKKKFEASKEKVKNGEVVVDWYNSGKARLSQKDVKDNFNNLTWYNDQGSIVQKFSNNTLYFYENGKLIAQGPGIAYEHGMSIEYKKHGVWKEDGKDILYHYGNNESGKFKEQLEKATTLDELEVLSNRYPYPEILAQISPKREKLKAQKGAKEKYEAYKAEVFSKPTFDGLKNFKAAYPDSVVSLVSGLIHLTDPSLNNQSSITMKFDNDYYNIKAVDEILLSGIKNKEYCSDQQDRLMMECILERNSKEASYYLSSKRYKKSEVKVSFAGGKISYAELFDIDPKYADNKLQGVIGYENGSIKYFTIYSKKYTMDDNGRYCDYYINVYSSQTLVNRVLINSNIGGVILDSNDNVIFKSGRDEMDVMTIVPTVDPITISLFLQNLWKVRSGNLKDSEIEQHTDLLKEMIGYYFKVNNTNAVSVSLDILNKDSYKSYLKKDTVRTNTKFRFDVYPGVISWIEGKQDETINYFKTRINQTYVVKQGSPSQGFRYVKADYKDDLFTIIAELKNLGVILPNEKEMFKRIKSLH